MSAYFQPASMGADLVTSREIDERIRQAREHEMVRAAKPRTAGRLSSLSLRPTRLLSALGAALRMPVAGSAHPVGKG